MSSSRKRKSGKTKTKKSSTRTVPYGRGFKPPGKRETMYAIGFTDDKIPPEYDPGESFFAPVPRPSSIDDWLAQYGEDGQSFRGYTWQTSWMGNTIQMNMKQQFNPRGKVLTEKYPDGKIYIVPVGRFDDKAKLDFSALVDYCRRFLCLPIATMPELRLELKGKKLFIVDDESETVVDTRFSSKTKHMQVSVRSVLSQLKSRIPQDALCMIGLTLYDLYGDDTDLFMAGLAAGNNNVAVFSIHRYDPCLTFSMEFWYDIKATEDVPDEERKRLILQRSCKLVVHEIGHLLGIGHCIYYQCCMNGSGHLEEDFRQPMHLCPVDLHKLQALTGFDVVDRYEQLLDFYKNHGMASEAGWIERRIKFIKDKN